LKQCEYNHEVKEGAAETPDFDDDDWFMVNKKTGEAISLQHTQK